MASKLISLENQISEKADIRPSHIKIQISNQGENKTGKKNTGKNYKVRKIMKEKESKLKNFLSKPGPLSFHTNLQIYNYRLQPTSIQLYMGTNYSQKRSCINKGWRKESTI